MTRGTDVARRLRDLVLGPRPAISRLPADGRARGRALVSYLREAVSWQEGDPRLNGHTNRWESREIARILTTLGFAVDVIDFSATDFEPEADYDAVLAIEGEMVRLTAATGARTALLHLTGSHPDFQNHAELRRIDELEQRRGVRCVPRRVVSGTQELDEAMRMADACSLLGNATTLATYPSERREKITCMSVTASVLRETRSKEHSAGAGDAFLWFFGSGAIHKGLDRALEAFARRPELRLHVVGNIAEETDFLTAYHHELYELPNIRLHGFLDPAGKQFARIAEDCRFLIAPTCSESMSPAVASMLVLGLYPVISRQTGISLPEGCGRYLVDCSVDDVEQACTEVAAMDAKSRVEQAVTIQADAIDRYSRARFTAAMRAHLAKVMS